MAHAHHLAPQSRRALRAAAALAGVYGPPHGEYPLATRAPLLRSLLLHASHHVLRSEQARADEAAEEGDEENAERCHQGGGAALERVELTGL